MSIFKKIGPGSLVAAAFIGPGTVTLCTIAGAGFGYALLWALLFSIVATIVLQEMTSRIGIVSGKGLAAVIKEETSNPIANIVSILLVFSAIVIGNLAYEAGNISGGSLGMDLLVPEFQVNIGGIDVNWQSIALGTICFFILFLGNYKSLEKVLIVAVVIMSLTFLIAALMTGPSWLEILKGLTLPGINQENLLTIIALIGTTIVPYNLFLHSSLVKERWKGPEDLKNSKNDTIISVIVGGVISMAIVISAANAGNANISNAVDLARSLEPIFGSFSKYLLGIGLLAAGVSSAITAPLAAALVARECFGWQGQTQDWKFRALWMSILIPGMIFSSLGFSPIIIIKFAQVVNGILLPVAVGFVMWFVNKQSIMSEHTNSRSQNVIGLIILGITLALGIKSILKVLTLI